MTAHHAGPGRPAPTGHTPADLIGETEMNPDDIRKHAIALAVDAVRRNPMYEVTDYLDEKGVAYTEDDVAAIERLMDTEVIDKLNASTTGLHIVPWATGEKAPTADAYRAACEALEKHRQRADELTAEIEQWRAAFGEDALRNVSQIMAVVHAARVYVHGLTSENGAGSAELRTLIDATLALTTQAGVEVVEIAGVSR